MTRPRVVILTGALGAGKTTLLKRILQDEPPGRTGLIVNEFAKGGIDQLVLGEDGFEPETLFGCLCCRDRGDVVQALDRLRGDRRTRRIVIETSGLVTLGVLIGELTGDPRFRNRYELGKVVTVVDAASGPDAILRGAPAGQLRAADLVVLSQLDTLHPAARPQAVQLMSAHLSSVAPAAEALPADLPRETLKDAIFGPRKRPLWTAQTDPAASDHEAPASAAFTLPGYIAPASLQDVARAIAWFFPGLLRFKMLTGPPGGQVGLINVTSGRVQSIDMLHRLSLRESHVYLIGDATSVEAASELLRSQVQDAGRLFRPETMPDARTTA